jgi:hypothetical protein
MSIRKKVSIKNVVLNFMEDTGLSHNGHEERLKRWARDADNKIGSFYSYKRKIFVLDVCNCTAVLPCEAVAVLAAIEGDYGDCCQNLFDHVYNNQATVNYSSTMPMPLWYYQDQRLLRRMSYEIQDNSLVFLNSSMNSDKITVQLLVYETDEDGYIKINENHVDAISMYLEYKTARRMMYDPKKQYSGPVKMIPDTKKEWNRLCRNARAEDSEMSETDKRDVAEMFNNPYSGYKNARWIVDNIYSAYL